MLVSMSERFVCSWGTKITDKTKLRAVRKSRGSSLFPERTCHQAWIFRLFQVQTGHIVHRLRFFGKLPMSSTFSRTPAVVVGITLLIGSLLACTSSAPPVSEHPEPPSTGTVAPPNLSASPVTSAASPEAQCSYRGGTCQPSCGTDTVPDPGKGHCEQGMCCVANVPQCEQDIGGTCMEGCEAGFIPYGKPTRGCVDSGCCVKKPIKVGSRASIRRAL
jgi:hypothetical protein